MTRAAEEDWGRILTAGAQGQKEKAAEAATLAPTNAGGPGASTDAGPMKLGDATLSQTSGGVRGSPAWAVPDLPPRKRLPMVLARVAGLVSGQAR